MPTLKYRDPATGQYIAVPGGSGGGGVFADEAERDAAISTPTEGMQCYMLNYHANMVYQNASWYPLPSGAGVQMSAMALTGGASAEMVYPTLAVDSSWGPSIGSVVAKTFVVDRAGMYSVQLTGVNLVTGDGCYGTVGGVLSLAAGGAITPQLGWVTYGSFVLHWWGIEVPGAALVDAAHIPNTTTFAMLNSYAGTFNVTYLGLPLTTGAAVQQSPPRPWPPFGKSLVKEN